MVTLSSTTIAFSGNIAPKMEAMAAGVISPLGSAGRRGVATPAGAVPRAPPQTAMRECALLGMAPSILATALVDYSRRPCILENHGRTLLANHDRGCIGVATDDLRHDRGVGDSQALDAVHLEPWVNNGVGSGTHAAGTDWMQVRDATIAQVLDQAFIAGDQRPWHNFLGDVRHQRRLLRKFPAQPGTEEHGLHVGCRLEEFEFDLRRRERGWRFEADAATPLRLQVHGRDHEARPCMGNDAVAIPPVD